MRIGIATTWIVEKHSWGMPKSQSAAGMTPVSAVTGPHRIPLCGTSLTSVSAVDEAGEPAVQNVELGLLEHGLEEPAVGAELAAYVLREPAFAPR
jgi:hypothetical protein